MPATPDFLKLSVYTAFFCVLLIFYGLPIHIMRDLFMTTRSFVKRLTALLKYKQALRDMNRYADATVEELAREDTCIICREEMRPWDPNAGQLERHRPKKLPCGHILHFGCLKSWLERQQVCPTCRSSVVAEQPARNPNYRQRMAFHLAPNAPNGQNQAAGANGPAVGAQDAQLNGQPGQNPGGRAAMRYINLGPIRLGFAQGGQEVADLANRMAVDFNDGNIPVVPQANVPVANPADLSTMDAVRNRLLEVDQRIHQEVRDIQQGMLNVQNAQQELQLINSMLNEVARLRHFQSLAQQQQQQSTQNAQPGHPAAAPAGAHPPAVGGVLPAMPLPTMFPQYPLLPPGQFPLPTFPPAPHPFVPRMSSPAMTRHGASANATSIPSGSPDLPDGVVIPPGWSLLPLQRLDQGAATNGAQGLAGSGGSSSQINNQGQQLHAGADTSSQPSAPSENTTTNTNGGPALNQAPADAAAPQVEVAAPRPLTPNWGGSAQFLGGRNGSSSSLPFGIQGGASNRSASSETRAAGESTEGTEPSRVSAGERHPEADGPAQAKEDNGTDDPSTKGKAPMATVEDAEDEA